MMRNTINRDSRLRIYNESRIDYNIMYRLLCAAGRTRDVWYSMEERSVKIRYSKTVTFCRIARGETNFDIFANVNDLRRAGLLLQAESVFPIIRENPRRRLVLQRVSTEIIIIRASGKNEWNSSHDSNQQTNEYGAPQMSNFSCTQTMMHYKRYVDQYNIVYDRYILRRV